MDDLGVIDRFTAVFIRYIDSGFGLLRGDVAFLTTILISIDIALAGLAWAMDERGNVVASLIKKILYVGFFALLLNNWGLFSELVFRSFAGLGLKASATGLTPDRLLQPGFVASTGFTAAHPLLKQVGTLMGFTSFFTNFLTIFVLLFAWAVVLVAFFLLAVQLFVTILEFKLTTLAGFVLVPFALWGKTTFLAERVLGNVIASGIKMMVLAVIIGIGTTFFGDFIGALRGAEPNIEQAMSLVLASLALFGLGIYGPSIAAGLISGAPQLGAGSVITTVGTVAAGTALAAGGVAGAAGAGIRGAAAIASVRAGASLASSSTGLSAPSSALSVSSAVNPSSSTPAPVAPVNSPQSSLRAQRAAEEEGVAPAARGETPAWAKRMTSRQRVRARVHSVGQGVKDGDRAGSAPAPRLTEE